MLSRLNYAIERLPQYKVKRRVREFYSASVAGRQGIQDLTLNALVMAGLAKIPPPVGRLWYTSLPWYVKHSLPLTWADDANPLAQLKSQRHFAIFPLLARPLEAMDEHRKATDAALLAQYSRSPAFMERFLPTP